MIEEIKLGLNGSTFRVSKKDTKLIEGYYEPSYRCTYNNKMCIIKGETDGIYLLQLVTNNQDDFVLPI